MYCSNCGAKLADNAKFCTECGAKIDASVQQPAVPSPSERQTVSSAAGTPAPQPAQGGDPKQGYVPPAGQSPYPYAGRPSGAQGQPKKRRTGLIAVLVLLALIPLTVILLVVALKMRHEEPPLPPLTEPSLTETVSGEGAVPTSSEAPTETAPTEPASAAEPTSMAESASAADGTLSNDRAEELLRKLQGVWNSDDAMMIQITREADGGYFFQLGYWYSEFVLKGYLRQPVKGDPEGLVSVWMYYEGEGTEDSYAYFPPMDEAVEFDLSRYEDGRLRWKNGDQWFDFYYGGATVEEAAPSLS